MFLLSWQQHGGSGLSMTWGEALDLSVKDRDWLLERIPKQRRQEAHQIEKAGKKRS
jgi:hypothetical protein